MQPEQSPYDFILSNGQPQKKSPIPVNGPSSTMGRALVFGGGLLVLLIIGIILMSVLGGDGGARVSLLKVSQIQQETVRVAETIRKDSSSQALKNAAINISLGVSSDKQTLSAAASPFGIAFEEKELLLGKSAETDKLLEDAKTAGTYNDVSLQVLNAQMVQYQKSLTDSFGKNKKEDIKIALVASSKNATLLQTQLENTQP